MRITAMRVDGGGTPALITEREQQAWTRTVMWVAIDSGQVFYGEDAERKEAEDVGAISTDPPWQDGGSQQSCHQRA